MLKKKVLITGAKGFIGKHLTLRLEESNLFSVRAFNKCDEVDVLQSNMQDVDFVIHLAGINRTDNPMEFGEGNVNLTQTLCDFIRASGRAIPVLFASSIQASLNHEYGKSKQQAEQIFFELQRETGNPIHIFSLPNVFGKWAKPFYNSVVATFCHQISRSLPIDVHDANKQLELLYIDDLVQQFVHILTDSSAPTGFIDVKRTYATTLGELAEALYSFKANRAICKVGQVGVGFERALYATYLSYLEPSAWMTQLDTKKDDRGTFVELLKTMDAGQFSYCTVKPGQSRGGHYHHTKNERFVVIKGSIIFRSIHIVTQECHEIVVSDQNIQVIETIPGWAHELENTSTEEAIVFIWANECFDVSHPDTITYTGINKLQDSLMEK